MATGNLIKQDQCSPCSGPKHVIKTILTFARGRACKIRRVGQQLKTIDINERVFNFSFTKSINYLLFKGHCSFICLPLKPYSEKKILGIISNQNKQMGKIIQRKQYYLHYFCLQVRLELLICVVFNRIDHKMTSSLRVAEYLSLSSCLRDSA